MDFIESYQLKLTEKSIIVITSKIVALAEGRLVDKINSQTKDELIIKESDLVLPTKYVCLTIKDGLVMANAGIDESNANNKLILLPQDSFKTASKIRHYFKKKYKLKKFGVIITDSRCLPLRAGITGVALGYAGFKGLKDYRKEKDIFGRPFIYSKVDVADSLATAAVLGMGEGNQQRPLAMIYDAAVEFCDRVNRHELNIDIKDDLYRPLFEKIL